MMETHSFLTWSVMGLIKSLYEKKLLPKDDPVISQLQKSFSKAWIGFQHCLRYHEEEAASSVACGPFSLRGAKEKPALGSIFPDRFSI